ncbi:host specificity factor TipJ family phage tail protein [Roseibium sp. FZY0029]|uniref:host specificity factor TipJ family phage tail protein n=1 Tax=Roseibium sp. FZY0029 TaxID=3116647 RepID=UPI002EC363A3|nr:host specificity factor TipJ family phage tail protein [Roseibium sp. FZY0029]
MHHVSPADLTPITTPLPPCTPVQLPAVMGASLAEIVKAHGPARSVAFYVTVNGEPVLRTGWDLVPAPSDIVEAVVLPRGGEDSKSVLGIVALIALSAFAPWAGGLIAGALGASSTGIVAGLAGAAILAGGGILINTLLAPKPATTASTDLAASPTYTANPSGNQARLYQTIPVQYGKHLMVLDYVSDPYQEFSGNDQYLFLLFGRGLGRSAPKDVRIGETVVWTDSEGYTGAIDDLEIAFYDPGEQIDLFPVQVETSSEVGGQLMDFGSIIGPYAAVPAGETAQKLGVDILLPEGLYTIQNSGGKSSATVQFHFLYREIDDLGAPIGTWQTLVSKTLTLTSPTPRRFTYSADVPAGRYEVRAERLNAWSDSDQTFDRLEWAGLRAYLDGPQSFPELSTMAVKVKVNDQLTQQSAQDFRLVQCRILPVWNGSAWVEQETRSIAWAAIDVARNPLYGAGEVDSKIDFATFTAYDTLWDARGDTFDGIFDTRQTRFDVINTVLAAGRASVRFAGDQISMVRDEQRSLPSQVFSDRNIVRGSLEVTYDLHQTDSADDVIVEYTDASSWTTEEVRCTIAQSSSEAPARVRMIGPTSRNQAWREGIHLAADNYFRREKATFRTELEGRLVARGDMIRIQSDMPQTWGKSGVVKGYAGLMVTLDREPETDPGNTYIRFRQKNGEEWGPCKITWTPGTKVAFLDSDDYNAVEIVFGALGPHLEDNGGEAPVYLLGEGVDFTFNGIVLGMVPEGKRVRLEVVRDNASVYVADGGLTVPDYPAGSQLPSSSGTPSILSLVSSRQISVTESFLSVALRSTGNADSFAIEISYDGKTWTPVYSGSLPIATFPVLRDALTVRAQAIGTQPSEWVSLAVAAAADVIRLPSGSIKTGEIGNGVITAETIADLAITAQKVAQNAITVSKIADGAVIATKIASAAITADKLVNEAVTSAKLANNSVLEAKLATNAVTQAKIADGAVIAAKIAANAISSDKLVNDAVTAAKLADNSVTAAKILAGAVGADQVAANAIAAKHLVVADFSNMIPDNAFADLEGSWSVNGPGETGWSFVTSSSGSNGRALRFQGDFGTTSGSITVATIATDFIPVEYGQDYAVGCQMLPIGPITGRMWMYLQWVDFSDNPLPGSTSFEVEMGNETNQVFDAIATAPPLAVKCYIWFRRAADAVDGTVTGTVAIRNVYLRRAAAGKLIVDGAITATKIAAQAVTAGKIAAGAVTATEIAAGTITATQLASSSVTTAKLAAGAVGADQIAANAIAAKHLVVADFSNMIPDNAFADLEGSWSVNGPGETGWSFVTSSSGSNGRALRFQGDFGTTSGSITVATIATDFIPVEYGQDYAVGCQMLPIGPITGRMWMYLQWVDFSDNPLSGSTYFEVEMGNETNQVFDTIATAPPLAAKCYIWFRRAADAVDGTVTGTVAIRNVYLRRAAAGKLIVDGAITATKIAAQAVTAGKIAAGAVTATEIAAGTITADKLSVSSLSALTANLGIVTAGKLQRADGTMVIDLDNKRIVIQ